jgi:hypothetical protein
MTSVRSVRLFLRPPQRMAQILFAQQYRQRSDSRMRPAMTPMTIPAMAPPDRPPELTACAPVRVILAPVATGARNGTVVVGDEVAVTITKVLLVGRMAGEIPAELCLEEPAAAAAAAHCPEVTQY